MTNDIKMKRIAEMLSQRVSQRIICKKLHCSDWLIQKAILKYDPPRRLPKGGRRRGDPPTPKMCEPSEIGPHWNFKTSTEFLRKPLRRQA